MKDKAVLWETSRYLWGGQSVGDCFVIVSEYSKRYRESKGTGVLVRLHAVAEPVGTSQAPFMVTEESEADALVSLVRHGADIAVSRGPP